MSQINILEPQAGIDLKSCNPNEDRSISNLDLDGLSLHDNLLVKHASNEQAILQDLGSIKKESFDDTHSIQGLRSVFSTQFANLKSEHKNSHVSQEKETTQQWEELNYDTIKITRGRQLKDNSSDETHDSAKIIQQLLHLREIYTFNEHQDADKVDQIVKYIDGEPQITWNKKVDDLPIMHNADLREEDGVIYVTIDDQSVVCVPTMFQFMKDLITLTEAMFSNQVASFCYKRTQYLLQKYKMHQIFNNQYEQTDQKSIKTKDFYNILKIDNHIHHSAAMSAKHLLKFIKNKMDSEPETIVQKQKDGTKLRLRELCNSLGMKSSELSLNVLDVQADRSMYKRFDRFNDKYNPLGQPKLREVFLKQDNHIKGRYLAEITKELIENLEDQKYVGCEWRVSIYGKNMEEWHKLGKWLVKYKLYSSRVRWMIQIPRLYQIYKKSGLIESFQDMIDNIFRPLFDITINPTIDPYLYQALFQIVGFDTVDDESLYENFQIQAMRTKPKDWKEDKNPPYSYWIYYIYANLYSLNALRQTRGLNTFKFRPHCGEAGDIDHLATAYLIADGINHGIELNKSPVLTYLYYLKQIGLAMSPVSNNKLFCRYQNSPFRKFFEIGLNVTLSTDDPLILHLTNEPLIEEYSIASQVFDLSNLDLAEIARNSVRQSSFEGIIKEYWLGKEYWSRLSAKNNQEVNNLPNTRFLYRKVTINEEYSYLDSLVEHTK